MTFGSFHHLIPLKYTYTRFSLAITYVIKSSYYKHAPDADILIPPMGLGDFSAGV